jgi:hypothetical protein
MLRSAASKALGLGRATAVPVVLAVMLVVVFGASPASAHKGYKGLLHLGHKSAVAKVTTLVGKVATGSSLVVQNPSGGSALRLQVNAGQAPLTVNATAGKATNLNADRLDGKDSSAFALAARTPIWAVVNANSTIRRSSPGVTGFIGVGGGYYQLTFNRDVSSCAYFATLDGGDSGEISTYRGIYDSGNTVRVATRNSSGAATPKAFYLAVLC